MLKLIRENSHGNDIATYYDDVKKSFYKSTFTIHGTNLIKNERRGINFFNGLNTNSKIFYKTYSKNSYQRIEIKQINGQIVDYKKSFYENSYYFAKVINFYLNYWPHNKKQNCHGDLTLDNIIFKNNKLIIFDWEHYNFSKKIFYGYDLIYLILSGIILPGEKNFDQLSKKEFIKLYKKLLSSKINNKFLKNPFENIDKIISNVLTKIFIKSPNKFFTISIKDKFKTDIINFMNKEIF
jgi:tRNA A-37 threonylcarbamoyl transferase component Bud32